MTSVDKTIEKKLVTGLKLLKTSIKSLNQSDSELTSELRNNQIRTRGMTERLAKNVTELESRVQELRRSSRNISSRVRSLERGYFQMNTLMKRIQAVDDVQNISHTALQTVVKRLNGSLINLNTTLYNKVIFNGWYACRRLKTEWVILLISDLMSHHRWVKFVVGPCSEKFFFRSPSFPLFSKTIAMVTGNLDRSVKIWL